MRSRSLNFEIAIVLRSFDLIAIADLDLDREKKIAIDNQKIADHSCLVDLFYDKNKKKKHFCVPPHNIFSLALAQQSKFNHETFSWFYCRGNSIYSKVSNKRTCTLIQFPKQTPVYTPIKYLYANQFLTSRSLIWEMNDANYFHFSKSFFFLLIGHWKKLHSKVSQGGARGARMNIFQ